MRVGSRLTVVFLAVALVSGATWALFRVSRERSASPVAPPPISATRLSQLSPAAATTTAARQASDAPLIVAARRGDVRELERRLSAGEDPSFVTTDGRTPLVEAVAGGSLEVVAALLEKGAAPNPAASSTPALFLAAFNGREDLVRLLLARGAKVDLADPDTGSRTPLIQAAERGHLAVVQLLVQAGALVSAADDEGRTALHRAAEEGHADLVQWLAEHGAPIDARDRAGATALGLARAAGKDAVVTVLVQRGAKREPKPELAGVPQLEPPVPEQKHGIAASAVEDSWTSRGWDGPVLPAYEGAALLNVPCSADEGSRLKDSAYGPGWAEISPEGAAGFTRGEAVLALGGDGTRSRAKLGMLRCVPGECRGDWVVSRLSRDAGADDVVAVAPLGFATEASRIVVPRGSKVPVESCEPLPVPRLRRPFETGCTEYDLGDSERLQVYWAADNDLAEWGTRWSFARPLRATGRAAWRYVGRAFGQELTPTLVIRGDGPTRILWTKNEGIGGPTYETVVVTRVTNEGVEVGRAFTAGGQPCD